MAQPETPAPGAVSPAGATADATADATTSAAGVTPRHAAVALAYAKDGAAPKVVAKGRGLVAQAIIERAREHGVFVHESKDMVALLMQVDLDQRIPPELYRAVAELLAWVYRLEQRDGLYATDAVPRTPTALPRT
jgi:flagellar biosynthesis protein